MQLPTHWAPTARQALESLVQALDVATPKPEALVVFGSLVTGGWREGFSNINVAVVLDDASPAVLQNLGPIFRQARLAAAVSPLVLERRELPRAIDVFPLKFAHIKAHHHLLSGFDPFKDLVIDLQRVRQRAEAELRNQQIRLRQALMFAGDDHLSAARVLHQAIKPFAMELEALLLVMNQPVPFEADIRAVFTAAASVVEGLDRSFTDTLSDIVAGARIESPVALLRRLPGQIAAAIDALEAPVHDPNPRHPQ